MNNEQNYKAIKENPSFNTPLNAGQQTAETGTNSIAGQSEVKEIISEKDLYPFVVQDRETGTYFCGFVTLKEAEKQIDLWESEDREYEREYMPEEEPTEDFYEIACYDKDGNLTPFEDEWRDKNVHIAELRAMFIWALKDNNLPFNKEINGAETELPYRAGINELFDKSNTVAAALHMAVVGSDDPRYFDEKKAKSDYGLVKPEDTVRWCKEYDPITPLTIVFKDIDEKGNYKEVVNIYYNAKQIENLPPYERPERAEKPVEVITPKICESVEAQLKENITKWQVALEEGKIFSPPETRFTVKDYIEAVKNMDEKKIAALCCESAFDAERILKEHQQKPETQNQNKIETGGRKL